MVVLPVFALLWTLSYGFGFGKRYHNYSKESSSHCLGFFHGKSAFSAKHSLLRNEVLKSGCNRHLEHRHLATTLDDVEVERLASSARKRKIVDSFVEKMGGKRSIQKVLIANNGYVSYCISLMNDFILAWQRPKRF